MNPQTNQLLPQPAQNNMPKNNHSLAIVLSIIGGAVALFIITPIILFAVAGIQQESTLKSEISSFKEYPLFAGWAQSDTITNINVSCLDQCSSAHRSFISKASDSSEKSNADYLIDFFTEKGYKNVHDNGYCDNTDKYYGCVVYGDKGSLQTSVKLPLVEGYSYVSIEY